MGFHVLPNWDRYASIQDCLRHQWHRRGRHQERYVEKSWSSWKESNAYTDSNNQLYDLNSRHMCLCNQSIPAEMGLKERRN